MKLSDKNLCSGIMIECQGRYGVIVSRSDRTKTSVIKWLGWTNNPYSLTGAMYEYSWDTEDMEVDYWRFDDTHIPMKNIPIQDIKQDKYRFLDLE